MRNSIKEEEVGGFDGHDKHDPTCCDNIEECYNVHNTDDVKNDKASAGLFDVQHRDYLMLKNEQMYKYRVMGVKKRSSKLPAVESRVLKCFQSTYEVKSEYETW